MDKKTKIIFDQSGCIGCGNCAMNCPKFFEMRDGLSFLKDSKEVSGKFELETEVSEEDLSCLEQAVKFCPVKVINIEKGQ